MDGWIDMGQYGIRTDNITSRISLEYGFWENSVSLKIGYTQRVCRHAYEENDGWALGAPDLIHTHMWDTV